jgi:ubiquinone/menaquinone biosynthesis C-methylase UbiE
LSAHYVLIGVEQVPTSPIDKRHDFHALILQFLCFRTNSQIISGMIGTLGEIPDKVAALRELRRVLKPRGRVVVSEVLIDPDYVSPRALEEKAKDAGFVLEHITGPKFSYFALLRSAAE